jgi:hypothetical protein
MTNTPKKNNGYIDEFPTKKAPWTSDGFPMDFSNDFLWEAPPCAPPRSQTWPTAGAWLPEGASLPMEFTG